MFKIGDKCMIKYPENCKFGYTVGMDKYIGILVTINYVGYVSKKGYNKYRVRRNDSPIPYTWCDDSLRKVNNKSKIVKR